MKIRSNIRVPLAIVGGACFALALGLQGCGGSDADPVLIAAAAITPPLTAANAPAFIGVPFALPAAVPALGTTGPATLTYGGTGAALTATVTQASGGGYTAVASFGSCIFRITSVVAPYPQSLIGTTFTVAACSVNVATAGAPANGTNITAPVTLVLNGTTSNPIPTTIVINTTGQVTINGIVAGTTTVRTGSGG